MYGGGRDDFNQKHGYGVMDYQSGHKYKGNYIHGIVNGHGFAHFKNGDEYKGNYVQNNKFGKGTYTWANGDKYDGEWAYNKSIGRGTMTYADGTIEVGEYEPIGMHIILQSSRDGISHISIKKGLFKISDGNGHIEYTYYDDDGELNNEKTLKYKGYDDITP